MTVKELVKQWDADFEKMRKETVNAETLEKYYKLRQGFYFDYLMKILYPLKSICDFVDSENYSDCVKMYLIELILNREV